MAKRFFLLFLLSLHILNCRVSSQHPVILVPGLAASRLWHKQDADDNYLGLWITPFNTFFRTAALVRDMTLNVNPTTGATSDEPGHVVKACGFGDPETLTGLIISTNLLFNEEQSSHDCNGETSFYDDRYDFEGLNATLMDMIRNGGVSLQHPTLNLTDLCGSDARRRRSAILYRACTKSIQDLLDAWENVRYYKSIVDMLKEKGYRVNVDIKGAPYDFRKAPNELTDFYLSLKQLVQNTYSTNSNRKVVMVAHSNGNPVLLHFYNNVVTTDWKDKYIRAHVALGPPWAGATKPLKVMVSGDNADIPLKKGTDFRPMQRSWPSIAWLMPSPTHGLWQAGEDLIVTPYKTYGVNDYRQLFNDLDYPIGYRLWESAQSVLPDLGKLPELRELHVLYGENVPTPIKFSYKRGAFPDEDPEAYEDGNGDGTVNRRSLEAFKKFPSTSFINVTHHAYPGMDHMDVLRDQRVLSFITNLVFSKEPALPPRPVQSKSPNAACRHRCGWQMSTVIVMLLGLLGRVW